jgi:hypothetical protein
MPTPDWYRCKADECVSLAKTAISNGEKARLYALAEYYLRLAMDELKPDVLDAGPARASGGALAAR